MNVLTLGTVMSVANMVLRGLQEAPDLIEAFETFWKAVAGNPVAPPHIVAAVEAAFDHVKKTPAP